MALVQSGYPVIGQYGDPQLDVQASIYGVRFPGGIRKGDVTTVLLYWAGRWHNEVEHLVAGHCWGYDKRDIRGGSGWSNHAGGCAIDINAPEHPQHTYTLSQAQINIIRRIRDDCGAVIRWGGDWTPGSVDQQHAEINLDLAGTGRVEALAARIRAGQVRNVAPELLTGGQAEAPTPIVPAPPRPAPTPSARPPEAQIVAAGVTVAGLQLAINVAALGTLHRAGLRGLVVDGRMGPATTAAVDAVQRQARLTNDRYVGAKTVDALNRWLGHSFPLSGGQVFGLVDQPGSRADGTLWSRLTRSGDPRYDSDAIRARIRQLQIACQIHWGAPGPVGGRWADGRYGVLTVAPVKRCQASAGYTPDGMVGPDTWPALFRLGK